MENEQTAVDLADAIDDFLDNVYPGLFPNGKKGNPDYYKIHAFKRNRKLQKQGKQNLLTTTWAIKILTLHGGEVNGKPRYTFQQKITVKIEKGD